MKKLLIVIIVTTWIAVHPTFCFALEWYNFKTAQIETIKGKILNYSPYIPQDPASQGLYRVYIKMGDTPTESAIKVLNIHICLCCEYIRQAPEEEKDDK